MFGGTRPGVWSGHVDTVPVGDSSRALWQFPVPAISFTTVTSDFVNLAGLAVGNGSIFPIPPAAHTTRPGLVHQAAARDSATR